MSLSVRREGSPNSSLQFVSKALAGEQKAFSFLWGMTVIMTWLSPVAPTRRFLAHLFLSHRLALGPFSFITSISNMHSYMKFIVVALAASSVCPVLSAPTKYRYGKSTR